MDYKLIYKPSIVLEAITLTTNVISVCISLPRIVCLWCSADGCSTTVANQVPLLPLENPLSHGNKNNRRLLEKAIALELKGIFTIATFCELCIVWRII